MLDNLIQKQGLTEPGPVKSQSPWCPTGTGGPVCHHWPGPRVLDRDGLTWHRYFTGVFTKVVYIGRSSSQS